MALYLATGQVAQSDLNPGGPSATSNTKDVVVKVVRLTSANFNTTPVNTLVAVLPADATILDMQLLVKTQLAGGGITAATVSLGTASAGTQFASAVNAFGAAGANNDLTSLGNAMQLNAVPLGADIQVWAQGTATTGNPTSGELFITIYYVR